MRKVWRIFLEHTTELIVCFSFSICLLFTIIVMAMSVHGIETNDTLIEWVFKFFGLELLALSGIKISKHIGSAFGRIEDAVDGYIYDGSEEEQEESEDDV